MSKDITDEHRYLFTVRQRFNEKPVIDCFHELTVPAGLTSEQAEVMTKLNPDFCKAAITEDTTAMHGMGLRLRFNSDMYQNVCLVRTQTAITAEDLEVIVTTKYDANVLTEFLDEAAVR